MRKLGFVAAVLLALAAHAGAADERVKLEYVAEPDYRDYWFAFVHFDPFVDKYVLDGVAPTRDTKAEEAAMGSAYEVLAVKRDGSRVHPAFVGGYDYRYGRPLGEVVDEPAKRIAREYPCNVSEAYGESYQKRHPCGSRFTKPTRMEYWPTLAARMAQRDVSAFAVAVPNPKEVTRALDETGLRARLSEVPSQPEYRPAQEPLTMKESLLVEASGTSYRADATQFLVAGVPVPADLAVVLIGDGSIWGRTKIPLGEVRQMRITPSSTDCPSYQVRLRSGEEKRFSRCNGSPLAVEIGDKLVDVDALRARGLMVRDGRPMHGMKPAPLTLLVGWAPVPGGMKTSLARLTSLGVLTSEEAARIGEP